MTFIHGVSCLRAHLLTQMPKTTDQLTKPEIIGGSAKPSLLEGFAKPFVVL